MLERLRERGVVSAVDASLPVAAVFTNVCEVFEKVRGS